MRDYQPLDLSKWCNAGISVLESDEDVGLGRQVFRGLPFAVGRDGGGPDDDCFIALTGSDGTVTVPVGQSGHNVIFAHRLLERDMPVGGQVAEYVFHLSGGVDERVAIRDLFEIGYLAIVNGWPRAISSPARAFRDQEAALMPRYEGSWELAGRRQTEADAASVRSYYLWAWRNPQPDRVIESIEIVPSGPCFVVAAITLGHVDEHPFAREGRRAARVVLTDPADAEKPFDLDVEVDRGDATYAFPLPEASAQEFLDDSHTVWGQEQNPTSSPAYVEVSAVSSATVTVRQGQDVIGQAKWGDVEQKGSVATPRMRVELIDPGKNWVHVTVLDDDTGKPVPCRVHFRSPEGVPFQPHGHHNQVNSNLGTWHNDVGGDVRLGQITYAYIDGTCQGWLPRGEVIVDVARGFEYEPLRKRVTIEPGQRELTLQIKRWTEMNAQRWFSGDSHVHFLSGQGAHLESQGEDLNVVNLLQSQWGSLFTNTEDFTGAPSVSQEGNSIVYVCQENRQHFMGHLTLWGLKKHVMPWCSDGLSEAEIGGSMEVTLSDWADQCHAQGGYVIKPHFGLNGEAAAMIATGRLDGVEMIRHSQSFHDQYYRSLSWGYRLPLVGGTDKMSSDVPVGLYRTYARLPDGQEFNYDNWCRSVASGRTFLSGGPIIHFSVDGREIGDTVQLTGPGTVEVEAWAESIFPINTLQVVQAGRVVASAESRDGTRRLELKERLKVDGHTWLAARCGGPDYFGRAHLDGGRRGMFAHTSPVYVACGGEWWMFDEERARYMMTLIDAGLTYIREGSTQHRPGTVTHHHGEEDHIAYLERPFHEAQNAVEERMRKLGIGV